MAWTIESPQGCMGMGMGVRVFGDIRQRSLSSAQVVPAARVVVVVCCGQPLLSR